MHLKILMAEDEDDVREILAKKVRQEGFEVMTAKNGLEAWELIQSQLPDVLILDLTMPVMTGYEVLGKLRANPPSNKWIPVIIISAHGELKDIQKGLSAEADHYLVKPCDAEEIVKSIRLMEMLIPQRNKEG